MQKNINKFIEYNIIISFLNKKRYKNKEKTKEIVHLIQDMEKKFINVHLELNSTNDKKLCKRLKKMSIIFEYFTKK